MPYIDDVDWHGGRPEEPDSGAHQAAGERRSRSEWIRPSVPVDSGALAGSPGRATS